MRCRYPANAQKGVNAVEVEVEASPFDLKQERKTIRERNVVAFATHISASDPELVSGNNDRASPPIQYNSAECTIDFSEYLRRILRVECAQRTCRIRPEYWTKWFRHVGETTAEKYCDPLRLVVPATNNICTLQPDHNSA